jgi:hypothetical protein
MKKYPDEAIARAKEDATQWLSERDDGYPRSWEQEARETRRRGYDFYDDFFEAPPIAGYEALEREGVVVRVGPVMKGDAERIHFKRVAPSNDDGTQPARAQVVA